MESVAIITGANSGIGLTVAHRFLSEVVGSDGHVRLVLACRNSHKASLARDQLLEDHPTADIDIIQLDTSSPSSVIGAAKQIKEKYSNIRWIFCNAGIMPVSGLSLGKCLTFDKKHWTGVFSTGEGILAHTDWQISDNLQAVFATNTLGHYLLIRELEDSLKDQDESCHIIWTSSNSAKVANIDINDIQDKQCVSPYPNSKRIMDILSLSLNERLNQYGIYSDTTCPGSVVSQMTTALFPLFIWYMLIPIIFLIRLTSLHYINFNTTSGVKAIVNYINH
jgi:17beta-estradiol 17-dehydrogenase/3beta-hydroxysteroid 3-dehydrogenase